MKKLGLGIILTAMVILSGCSHDKNVTNIHSSTKSSSTKISSTETSTAKSSEKIVETKKAETSKVTYQLILDEYTEKLQDKAPKLVDEYNVEYPYVQGGINALADLANKKVAILAEISNEGVSKMAGIQLSTQDKYSIYEEWASKLMAVYSEESQKIMDAYMASATSETPEFSEPSYGTIESPKQPESEEPTTESEIAESEVAESYTSPQGEEYTTVQAGEGPNQIAARTGVPVETIYKLNGMAPDSYFFSVGDSIRIK